MNFFIEHIPEGKEKEVIIRCQTEDESVQRLIHFLESSTPVIIGDIDKNKHILEPEKIFYIESFDRKVFINDDHQTYETHKKLYELETELSDYNFFRASKWMILNINKIVSVRPLFDGRFEALLENNKRVYISRKYVSLLKQKLGIK